MAQRFRADPPELRIIRPITGFMLVYHRPSGQTHLLASPAVEILDALAVAPASAAELTDRLAADRLLASTDEPGAVIAARLAELAEAGLVEPL